MKVTRATLVEMAEAWPGVASLSLAAPELGLVAPGQFVLLRAIGPHDPVLPMALLPRGHDAGTGTLTALSPAHGWRDRATAVQAPGVVVQITGPFGRPFVVDRRSRHALFLGAGPGVGALLYLAQRLVDDGHDVTFIGAATESEGLMPAGMLPHDVEYLTAPASASNDPAEVLTAMAEPLLAWADALYVALPFAFLEPLLRASRRRLLRLRKGYAQALVAGGVLPCGVGACDLCTIVTREGYRRLCRDGLVFDLLSLV